MLGDVNYWRVATIVLLSMLVAASYSISVLIQPASSDPAAAGSAASTVPVLPATASVEKRSVVSFYTAWPSIELPEDPNPGKIEFEKPYNFDRDWHSRHVGYWRQALEPFRGKPNLQYLEVGLFEGASFFWVLEEILTDPSSRATGIDPFFKDYSNIRDYGATFFENLELSGKASQTRIISGFSQTHLRKLDLESYDIIYIDGSHQVRDVLEDAILAWRLLKPGGLLIFDDYQLWWDRPLLARPRVAVDIFYAFYGGEFEVVHFGYQVILRRKTKEMDAPQGN